MRELKFRAWHEKTKAMSDLNKATPLALAITPSLCGAGIGVYVPDHPDLIIMQFIGLKDINGKDVYEGDKFEDEDNTEGYLLIEFNESEARFEFNVYGRSMYYNEGGGEEFSDDIQLIDQNITDISYVNEIKIIGNIYQNGPR